MEVAGPGAELPQVVQVLPHNHMRANAMPLSAPVTSMLVATVKLSTAGPTPHGGGLPYVIGEKRADGHKRN